MNYQKLLGISALAVAITGAFVLASKVTDASVEPSLADKLEQGTAHISYEQPMFDRIKDKQVVEKIKNSWDRAYAVLAASDVQAAEGAKDWELINSGDIDIDFTNHLSQKEAFSFNAAINSEERNKALETGDYWPAVLVNKAEGKAVLFWERINGSVVAVNIDSKSDKDNARSWFVEGPAREYK